MKNLLLIIHLSLSLSLYSQIFSPKDSLALLEIDAICDISDSLNWNTEPNPLNWEGVTWEVETPKRVTKLEIVRKSLSGILDVTPFDSIALLNCNENEIDSLLLNNLNKLTDIECSLNNLSYLDISTLNNLIYLICSYNNIDRLDISDTNNYNLQFLNCFANKLKTLNFSALPNLKILDITGGSFKTLAFPENNSLIGLGCSDVGLQDLDISNLTQLEVLFCADNELTELKLDNQTKLNELECWGNSLTKLDISATTSLWWLGFSGNNITELDISNQYYLSMFDAQKNQLKKLKLGKHRFIQYFDCSDNQLTELDLSGVEELLGCVVNNNKLPFSSLATGAHAFSYTYSPQNTLFEPQTCENNTTLDYTAEASIEDTATEFVFFKDNDMIEINSSGLFTTRGSGVYHCQMTNSLFPDLTLKTASVTITGGTEIESLLVPQLSCYPNPVTNVLHLNHPQNILISKLSIYNFEGKELLSFKNLTLPFEIDMTNFKTGIYVIRINTSDLNLQFSIIKE